MTASRTTDRKSLPPGLKFAVWRRDGFRCRYCGKDVHETGVVLEVDHVIPVALGGTDEHSNLVTACRDCNRGKSDGPAVRSGSWIFDEHWGVRERQYLAIDQARLNYEQQVITEIVALHRLAPSATSPAAVFRHIHGAEPAGPSDLRGLAEDLVDGAADRLADARQTLEAHQAWRAIFELQDATRGVRPEDVADWAKDNLSPTALREGLAAMEALAEWLMQVSEALERRRIALLAG